MKKLTLEEFIEKANRVHKNKYDYSKVNYINSRIKVCIICPDHGEFWQTPNAHLSGQKCPKCSIIDRTDILKLTTDELLHRFRKIHGNQYEYDFSNYENVCSIISIKCIKHDYIFKQAVYHHLNGSGCPICNGGSKYTNKEFIIKAREVHGDIYNYSKVNYIDKETPVEIVCPLHGSFWQKPHDHICGCGCPNCKSWKTQRKIFNFLNQEFNNIKWEWEYSPEWLGLQRFDIYSPDVNLAIEYNGEQHYIPIKRFGGQIEFQKTLSRDKQKLEKCKQNNCILYTIKYDNIDYDKIKEDINYLIINNYAN